MSLKLKCHSTEYNTKTKCHKNWNVTKTEMSLKLKCHLNMQFWIKMQFWLEVTCCFENNIESAHIRKAKKYNDLKVGLESFGWVVHLIPFEVGSRGQITKINKNALINVLKRNQINVNNNLLFKDTSKISLLCSYSVFQAHCVPTWTDLPYLHP